MDTFKAGQRICIEWPKWDDGTVVHPAKREYGRIRTAGECDIPQTNKDELFVKYSKGGYTHLALLEATCRVNGAKIQLQPERTYTRPYVGKLIQRGFTMSDYIKLRVCIFDKNCEEYPTDSIIEFTEEELLDEDEFFSKVFLTLNGDDELQKLFDVQGFSYKDVSISDVTIQTDTRDNVIRIRDSGDFIGDPGNIACMFNLRLVE